jgi:hypothetical protein
MKARVGGGLSGGFVDAFEGTRVVGCRGESTGYPQNLCPRWISSPACLAYLADCDLGEENLATKWLFSTTSRAPARRLGPYLKAAGAAKPSQAKPSQAKPSQAKPILEIWLGLAWGRTRVPPHTTYSG